MKRTVMINTIGTDYLVSNIENDEETPHAIPDPTQSCGVSAASGAQDQKAERLFIS